MRAADKQTLLITVESAHDRIGQCLGYLHAEAVKHHKKLNTVCKRLYLVLTFVTYVGYGVAMQLALIY